MIDPSTSRPAARERIRTAYDPQVFAESAHTIADQLAEHLRAMTNGETAALNWQQPEANIDAARRHLVQQAISQELSAKSISENVRALVDEVLNHAQNLHHPHYVGHQVPPPIPLAGLFDAIASFTNQPMAIYEMGPWATAVEQVMIDKLGSYVGWRPGSFSGLITSGGSLANLTCLLTARNVQLGTAWTQGLRSAPSPALVVQQDAHYCVARAAGILGIGTENVLHVAVDERRRMRVDELTRTLETLRAEQRPVIAVVACAGATPTGAFDPLVEIAEVCRRHAVWFHVDAAHGGAALMSEQHRRLLDGIEQADSFIWDAHKMLHMPALCAFAFYKDAAHRLAAFDQDAPYLFDPTAPDLAAYDVGRFTIECTKRAAAFGLWGVWSIFGPQLFADIVDVTFDLARRFHQKLTAAEDFEPLNEPECNILVFRHIPERLIHADSETLSRFQYQLRRRVIESGKFYLVATQLDGVAALRTTIINPLTTSDDLDELLETLREIGAGIS